MVRFEYIFHQIQTFNWMIIKTSIYYRDICSDAILKEVLHSKSTRSEMDAAINILEVFKEAARCLIDTMKIWQETAERDRLYMRSKKRMACSEAGSFLFT